MDSKKLREYQLLRSYEDNIITRGILLRIPFVGLEQIENNTWSNMSFSDAEKLQLKSMIQIDIVSKIMMYIEDLAIISESFIRNRDFYELLMDSSINIGELTGLFIKEIASFSDKKLSDILNYLQPNRIFSDEKSIELVNRLLKYHIDKVKNDLLQIGYFSSEANHLLYKRFKHAGMPIFPNTLQISPGTGPLGGFEVYSVISEGKDPFRDILILPYSKDVLVRYEKIACILQNVLRELVRNKKICIERSIDGMIPPEYSADMFSSEERSLGQALVNDFYNTHPILNVPKRIEYNFDTETTQKMLGKIKWYLREEP